MRRLIIVRTFFQLIVSIQMKLTIFKDDKVVIILSDHSKNAEVVCHRLRQIGLFESSHYVKIAGVVQKRKLFDKIKDFIDITFCKNNRYSYYLNNFTDLNFDEIICFNFEIDIYGLFSIISQHNIQVKISCFEEGLMSYNLIVYDTIGRRIIRLCRKILGKPIINLTNQKLYCFYPDQYCGPLNPFKIPKITATSEIINILKICFQIEDNNSYQQKYIFFTSMLDLEGGKSVGEYECVCKVAALVGKENLIIKTHPRDTRTIYYDNGFCVDKNSSIPWEAIQLSYNFSKNVFLTVNSTSVLAGSLMSDNPVKTFYMYKMCDFCENPLGQKAINIIYSLINNSKMQHLFGSVRIAEKVEDILY